MKGQVCQFCGREGFNLFKWGLLEWTGMKVLVCKHRGNIKRNN